MFTKKVSLVCLRSIQITKRHQKGICFEQAYSDKFLEEVQSATAKLLESC